MRAILVGAVAFASFIVASRSSQATHRVEECKAPQEWFKASGTDPVPVDFAIADNGDECAFYKWAWQSFLWLSQTDSGEPTQRFILFKTPNDLFDAAGDRKLQLTASPMGTKDGKRVLSLSVRNSPRTSRDV